MKIAIIGSGYVGLVTGACLADIGHDVTCIDIDAEKIAMLVSGQIPFYEPGLEALVMKTSAENTLKFSTEVATGVKGAEIIFIAVGTPPRRSDGHVDISAVYSAARQVSKSADKSALIVSKSTVPVGTSDEIERIIREESPYARVSIASNPEFLREGCAIADFQQPDRIIIGVAEDNARRVMSELYQPLAAKGVPVLFTSRRDAELIKYAANAFLAVKITFINEIADLCEATGADVAFVSKGIGLDSRIGSKFLQAGPGFGGSCFPKDTTALVKTAQDFGRPLRLIETTVSVNDQRKRNMARKIIAACGGSVRKKTIAILGLTFKPNTDDLRGAPSLDIISALQDQGAIIQVFDPKGMDIAKTLLSDVTFSRDPYDAAYKADAVVIVTEWDIFCKMDLGKLRAAMSGDTLVDLRNIFSAADATRAGLQLTGLGRQIPLATAKATRVAA